MLTVWEAGRGRSQVDRALLMLVEACPETSLEALGALPCGQRDTHLLTLREWTFGPTLSSLAVCPACDDRLELSFTVADVRAAPTSLAEDALSVEAHGYEVTFRLPSSADLASVVGVQDARGSLLERCVQHAKRDGERREFSQLPARVLDAVVERMSEADPQAEVSTSLKCPSCAHAWQAAFDIVSFFWKEVESWVHRTLREVHALATAYGWSEPDVLALSPWRRQYYLQLAHR